MATDIIINGSFVLDETNTFQDNDVAVTELPAAFSTRLFTGLSLSNAFPTAVGVGKSAANFIQVNADGPVTALNLLDSGGNALDGDASGLYTLANNQIFLYLDPTNSNIVLGREGTGNVANATGDVVMALYLDAAPDLTSARMWSVLLEPLRHPNGANHDDRVNLGDALKIGATSALNFSFENAPSGANLFMAFGSPAAAIVATGRNPLDQSAGGNISSGDTVNSGQGGGGVTLGTGIQGIKVGEGMYFTYVTGMNPDFIAGPNPGPGGAPLDPNEADIEANIDFTGMFGSNTAMFQVVKMSGNVTATLRISTFTTDNESGVNFVNGLNDADDAANKGVITEVKVNGVVRAFTTNADGSITVSNVAENDVLSVTTAGQHNRILIENITAANINFSIGSFALLNLTTDLEPVGQAIGFDDDGPTAAIALTGQSAITDESTPPPANDGGLAEPDDEVGHAVSLVADVGLVLIGYDQATLVNTAGSSTGNDGLGSINVTLALSANGVDSGLDTTNGTSILLYKEGAVVVGRAGGPAAEAIFAIAINNAGLVTIEQYDTIAHLPSSTFDDLATIGNGKISATVTVNDGDTDQATMSVDLGGKIGMEDDGPAAQLALRPDTFITVDESVGVDPADPNAADETHANAPAGAIGYAEVTGATLFSTQTASTGEDEEGATTAYSLKVEGDGASGLMTTAGAAITLVAVSSTVVEGRYSGSNVAFRVTTNATNGDTSLALFTALNQPTNPLTYDEAVQVAAGKLSGVLTVTDGDTDKATATVDLGPRLSFEDDGLSLDVNPVTGGDLEVGNVVGAEDSDTFVFDGGSDGAASFKITDAPDSGGYTWQYFDVDGDGQVGMHEIRGSLDGVPLYTLKIEMNGTYTFKLLSALQGVSIELDTNDIKAGGPDTNFIDVGLQNSDDFVRISGFLNGAPEAVNESNLNVGVDNGNLDAGEALEFQVITTDPDTMAQSAEDISSITIGTKTPKTTQYAIEAFDDGVLVYSTTLNVGKNGSIVVKDPDGDLFDTVRVTSVDGNAVKIGLRDIFIEILPEDQALDFSAILFDGDSDQSQEVDFTAFIDGNNDGIITLPDAAVASAVESASITYSMMLAANLFSGGHDMHLYDLP